jgi:dTDP-L-rhamnose 4-epimerase
MYQIASYTDVNCTGTAELLESLARQSVKRLVVASSMSIYGEGLYRGRDGRISDRIERPISQLRQRGWDVFGPEGEELQSIVTPETKFCSAPLCLCAIGILSGVLLFNSGPGLWGFRCGSALSAMW